MRSFMASPTRTISSVLLLAGVAIVFVGLSAALGSSAVGLLASAAAIAGLLYAGAVWFGGASHTAPAILFSHDLLVLSGEAPGTRVTDLFEPAMRDELETRCRAALSGHASGFVCAGDPRARHLDVAPVALADGTVPYGLLLCGLDAAMPHVL